MARPFMRAGVQAGVIVDGRETDGGSEQARLRRLAGIRYALATLAAPGTFPVEIEVERDELMALLDFAADGDLVADARARGSTAERERIVAAIKEFGEMRNYAGIPAHVAFAFQMLVNDVAEMVAKLNTTTGERS